GDRGPDLLRLDRTGIGLRVLEADDERGHRAREHRDRPRHGDPLLAQQLVDDDRYARQQQQDVELAPRPDEELGQLVRLADLHGWMAAEPLECRRARYATDAPTAR